MADVIKNMFGGSSPSSAAQGDDDFADFAGAPDPSPAPLTASASTPEAATITGGGAANVPYTKWYRVWERTSPSDFWQEAFVVPFIIFILAFHFWGTRKNRRKAKAWAVAHSPLLQSEFAVVGFGGVPKTSSSSTTGVESELVDPEKLLKEKTAQDFQSYATGRQNVAFLDVSIKLVKRYNPLIFIMDTVLGLFFESFPPPVERVESTLYAFDGKEKDLVPAPAGDASSIKTPNSTYDGFIWAIVHKNCMRRFRVDRYDASITFTKENPKLPAWTTVMSESAEITDLLLTPALIKAVEEAGDDLEYLIITDQPVDRPTKLEETTPKKRVQLSLRVPATGSYESTLALYSYFLRLPDTLVASAHFRPEVTRKLRHTRDEEIRRLRKLDEEEKAEERRLAAEKIKKEERERILRSMSAEEQRKYLEREKEKEQRRLLKKSTRRG